MLDYFNRSVNKSKLYQIRLTLHTQFQPLSTTFRFYYPSIRQFIQRAASLCRTYYFCVMCLLHSSSSRKIGDFPYSSFTTFFRFLAYSSWIIIQRVLLQYYFSDTWITKGFMRHVILVKLIMCAIGEVIAMCPIWP